MATIHCPQCGEEYSDTYKTCPFCQEAEALKNGRPIRRRGKRLDKRARSAGAGGVMLALAVVIIAGVAGYVFFGEQLASLAGIRTNADRSDLSQFQDSQGTQTDQNAQTGQDTQDGQTDDTQQPDDGVAVDPNAPVEPLTLDFDTISIPAGETARITAAGGTGSVTWDSSNSNIATVEGGSVTGVAGGTVTITAKAGEETATCTVTVTGDPWVSTANLSLNKTDITIRSSDPAAQLKIKGEYTSAVWSSSNTGVASVSDTGLVKRTGSGRCTITATVDGQVLECIIRCP